MNIEGQDKPTRVLSYADPKAGGLGATANPLFGTTTAQMAALFTLWGDDRGNQFLAAMKANQVKLSTGNGESADLVASGELDFALVDSDDAVDRIRWVSPLRSFIPIRAKETSDFC